MGFSLWKQNQDLGLNREQIPQPDPLQRGPGVSMWGAAAWGGQERSGVKEKKMGREAGRSVPPTPPGCQGGRLREGPALDHHLGYSEHPHHRHPLPANCVCSQVWMVVCQAGLC